MKLSIKKYDNYSNNDSLVLLSGKDNHYKQFFTKEEQQYITSCIERKKDVVAINKYNKWIYVVIYPGKEKKQHEVIEKMRLHGHEISNHIDEQRIKQISILNPGKTPDNLLAFLEGLALSNYRFVKYFKEKAEKAPSLKKIKIIDEKIS